MSMIGPTGKITGGPIMKFLVTAASKHGATAEMAEWIADGLRQTGAEADARPPTEVASVAEYDAVVLGSAVYAGKWLHDATDLVERLGADLRERPVWLFSSGPIGDPPKPETDPVDVASVVNDTNAREHRVFAGLLERSRLGFGERAVMMALRAPEGDFRPRPEIEAWAHALAGAFAVAPVANSSTAVVAS
jgi:menaquinone-dependent protoporphyrinogen oxidase